jgi:hypothetical protein
MTQAQAEYEVSAREAAMLDNRLAALLNERAKLVDWDTDEEAPREANATTNS